MPDLAKVTEPFQGTTTFWGIPTQGSRDAWQPWAMRRNSFGVDATVNSAGWELLTLGIRGDATLFVLKHRALHHFVQERSEAVILVPHAGHDGFDLWAIGLGWCSAGGVGQQLRGQ